MSRSRAYRSELREQHALDTRSAILHSARALFGRRGYQATPLTDIAASAGVSVPTLYSSVGSKTAIAVALVELVEGEQGLREAEDAEAAAITPRDLVRANVRRVRMMKECCGDIMRALMTAAAVDSGVLPAMEQLHAYHRDGQFVVAARLGTIDALRPELSVDAAGAILASINSPDVYTQFTWREHWPLDSVEAWMAATLPGLILRNP